MSKTVSDIYNFIDFSLDYYELLDVDKTKLQPGKNLEQRKYNRRVLHKAFQKQAWTVHPDRYPDDQKEKQAEIFKNTVRAYEILSDPQLRRIYENGDSRDSEAREIGVDPNSLGKFRQESIENEIGTILFSLLMENISGNHKMKFFPYDEEYHNFTWEIELEDSKMNLALSIVKDEDEVLRLTSSDDAKESLPFKIYIFFPSAITHYEREPDTVVETANFREVYRGKILSVKTIDAELYAGTNLEDAVEYIRSGKVNEDIEKCTQGHWQEFLPVNIGT